MKQLLTFLFSLWMVSSLQAQVSTFPYLEDFESGPGGWTSGGVNSSWALADPALSVINAAASGDSCWVTATGGQTLTNYNNSENSFVLSPNFNFTSLALPVIKFDVWWDSEFSWDGAVLQSSTDGGVSWSNVGAFGDPNNWYNDNTINGNPGGNQPAGNEQGWTGSGTNSSGGWVSAEHVLVGLGGQTSVDLRVAFGSDGSVNTFNGFAFDDVEIYESPPIDMEVVSVDSLISSCGLSATETIGVTVENLGSVATDSITYFYSINGGTPVSEVDPLTVVLPGGQFGYVFSTPANLSVAGTYTITVWIQVLGDPIASNDTLVFVVENIPVVSTFPYFENFESGSGGWTSGGALSTWALGTPAKDVIIGASSGFNAWVTGGLGTGEYAANEQSYVVGPCFDLSTLVNPQIRMEVWWNSEFSWDGAVLQTSTDNGLSWANVGAFGDPDNWYNDNSVNGNPGGNQPAGAEEGWTGRVSSGNGSGGWLTAEHALTGLAGTPAVLIRVAFGSDGSVVDDGFAFDDIQIFDPPPFDGGVAEIFTPISGCGLGIDTIRVQVCNDGTDTLTNFQVVYSIDGGTPVVETYTDTILPDTCVLYQFLSPGDFSTPGTTYSLSAWTAGIVGDPNVANDTSTITLIHQAPIATFPYTQNFDGAGWVPDNANFAPGNPIIVLGDNWENQQGENSTAPQDWAIRSAATPSGNGPGFDHTTGTTNYLFVEDSFPFDNDTVNVLTPCFDLGALNAPQLTFWYHSNNSNPGASDNSLHLDILYQGQWILDIMPTIGHKGNIWEEAVVDLSAYSGVVGLRFRVNNNNVTSTHDIAIDDFEITDLIPFDAGIASIISPITGCGLQALDSIVIEIENFGTDTLLPGFQAAFSLDGGTPVTATINDTILPDEVLVFTFPTSVNLSTPSTIYTLDVWTFGVTGDTNIANDSLIGHTALHRPAITTFPYIETFDAGAGVIPVEWENASYDGPQDWLFVTGASPSNGIWGAGPTGDHTSGGGYYAVVSDQFLDNDSVILITPCFDLTGMTNGAVFSFWYHSNEVNGAANPTDENEMHIDMYYNGDIIYDIILPIVHKNNLWNQAEINLAAYPGVVGFRFRVNNNNGVVSHEIAIDDIQIQELLAQDAGVIAITSLSSECGLSATEPFDIDLRNFGTDTIFSVDVVYTINGGTPTTVTIIDTIPPQTIESISLGTLNLSVPDDYTITAYTVLTGDTNNLLDSTTIVITSIPSVSTYPYFEDFEAGTGGWRMVDNSNNSTWEIGTPAATVINSAYSGTSAWMTGLAAPYKSNDQSVVIGPCFDFSTLSLPVIEMAVWWESENGWDGAVLQASTDSGLTWVNVGAFGDPNNWYNNNNLFSAAVSGFLNGEAWTGRIGTGSGGWLIAKNNMASLAGEPDVLLRVAFASDGSVTDPNGFAFDDITIRDTPPNDMGVTAQISPASSACGDSATAVEVTLVNFGTAPQTNVPVTVNVGGAGSGTITGTFPGPLAPGDTATFVVGSFNTTSGGVYTFTSYTNLTGDGFNANDTTLASSDIGVVPAEPTVFSDSSCVPDSIMLTASTLAGTIFWYDSLTGGSQLAVGDTFMTPFISGTETYYVQARTDQAFNVGAVDNTIGAGANYTFFPDGIVFDALAPFTLNSVKVYPFSAGTIVVNLEDAAGATLQTSSFAFGGTVPDTTITLDWIIAPGSDYQLNADGTSTGGLFRNSAGAVFPYTLPGVVSLTNTIDGLGTSGFYYFFYDWTVTSAGCASERVPVQAVINAAPPVNLGPDAVVCAGFPIDATTPGVISFLWSTGETSSSIVVDQSGTYYVDVVDLNGCTGTDTINMTILPSPTVDLGADQIVCGSATLDAGNPGAVYVWQDGSMTQTFEATTSGTYFVTATLSGCPATDTINVTVLPAPSVDLGLDLAICQTTTLDAGNPGATYLWSTGETTQSISVAIPAAPDTISVSVTNADGCTETDEIIISAGTPPVINIPATLAACDDTTLNAGNPGSTFLWSTGETTQSISVAASGTYDVTVTNAQGCTNTATVDVTVSPAPDPTITYNNVGFTYTFNTELTQGATYSWDFGDGSAPSTDQNPVYTFLFPGVYQITLTVSNACGTETITETIGNVSLEDQLFISQLQIYPNPTDGKFFVIGEEVKAQQLTVEVSDARGRIVFNHVEDNVNGLRLPVDISQEAEGMYVVKVTDGTRTAVMRILRE